MKPADVVASWVIEMEDFIAEAVAARRGMKRLGGGRIDPDDEAAYAEEERACREAAVILREVPLGSGSVDELRANALKSLQARWTGRHDSPILKKAVAVIHGGAEGFYGAYHPRKKA